jgi:YfiH family protein
VSVLTSRLLAQCNWLEHGFGTRDALLDQTAMASLKQIHSSRVLPAASPGSAGEGDALIVRQPGLAASIRTADCFPVLLADPSTRSAAAIHAGWRGTDAGIVGSALAAMREAFGTNPKDVLAAIGPGIGPCCYEVGLDVAQKFGMAAAGRLDLAAENRRQLLAAGIPSGQIDQVGGCTFCNAAQFFSWRRDHDRAGRMISFIRVLPPP